MANNQGEKTTLGAGLLALTLVSYILGRSRGKRRTIKQLNKLNHK